MLFYYIELMSDEYGSDLFEYDSLAAREAGLEHLRESAETAQRIDGVTRWFRTWEQDEPMEF